MATNTPKTMSSRLATMKFMQRSASKSSPSTPNGPPAKKVRLSNGTSAPGTPTTPSDRSTPQFPTTAEDKKREEALARAAEASGESRWVLSFKDPLHGHKTPAMQVRQAGFAVIDADEDSDDEEEEQKPVRMQFGGGLKKTNGVRQRGRTSNGYTDASQKPATVIKTEDTESESDSSDLDQDDPTAALIRETKRGVKAKERDARRDRQVVEDTPKRYVMPIDEDMDLGGLTSLSGGGGNRNSNVECHRCKQKGHISAQCPRSFAPRGFAGRGGGRGRGRR
ncbi:hypothetical protein K458DRAFT_337168 [Lentithecium fluviatile CBS 122367]|uniref:CCHC-type domain-containing protein n=1 Tax=Lentithecium fluviatile CBS 122367 TaxID=1168545 RepID=A0A6G1J3U9_9PLEO|nr:hypothetical protein K458DRAFT_337168 [Lentithecium fluviatile CBS 122367]